MMVRRTLPHRDRRMVGAWCFVDHYGPDDVSTGPGMQVPPHPHIGLQTVSWLLDGTVLHRDSEGSVQTIRPSELNLMTAGRAIAHSEESPAERPPYLHGVQLWVALPSSHRHAEPLFHHHADLPTVDVNGARARVIMGAFGGARSPALAFTPIMGAEITLVHDGDARLPLDATFEHGFLALTEGLAVDGMAVPRGAMLVLEPGRVDVKVSSALPPSRALLIGGEPFDEELVMWWNFVARTHEEIVQARDDWESHRRFGDVHGYDGDRLPAPPLPAARLRSRPRRRPPA